MRRPVAERIGRREGDGAKSFKRISLSAYRYIYNRPIINLLFC